VWMILASMFSVAGATPATDLMADLDVWKPSRLSQTAPKITLEQISDAFNGEIISGVEVVENIKAGKGYAVGVIDAPIEVVWRGVVDVDHHADYLAVTVSKTIRGTPRLDKHHLFQYLDVPIFSDRWWVVQMSFNSELYKKSDGRAWEITWIDRQQDKPLLASLDPTLIDSGVPIRWAKGAWYLVDLGANRTFVEYHNWTDPGGRVPVGPATRFASGEVKDNMQRMMAFAQSHAKDCPETFVRPDGSPL